MVVSMEERHSEFFEKWLEHRDMYFAKIGILFFLIPGLGAIVYLYILLNPSLSHLAFILNPFFIVVTILCVGILLILTVLNIIIKNPPNRS